MTKDEAIAKTSKAKRGKMLTATLEKRDNQVVWEVKVEDSNHSTSAVQIDPRSGETIKMVENPK